MLLIVSANFPDIDILLNLISRDAYVFLHRGFTHSLHGVILQALLLAWLARFVFPVKSFGLLFGLALLGQASHVLMDLANAWGTMIFWPFSGSRYALGWVAIIDPWMWGLLAAGLVAGMGTKVWSVTINRVTLGLLAGYYLFCGANQVTAKAYFRKALAQLQIRVERVEAFPQFQNPFRWNVIGWAPDRYYQGYVHALDGLQGRVRIFFMRQIPPSLESPFVKEYRRWAGAPLLRHLANDPEGAPALCDLRFLGREEGLPFVVRLSREGAGQPRHRWVGRRAPPAANQEFELP